MTFIMFCYYIITAILVFFLGWNFYKTKDMNKMMLYALAMFPFLLRLLRLK
jgi:hypothetical protein